MQPKDPTISFVCDTTKDRLWNMLMHNFLLRMPEVENPAQEAAARLELEARVKKFALSKMAEQFKNWKKNLYLKFFKVDKTMDFEHGYGNIREKWDDFVAYKKSEYAQQRSEINQPNAAMKIYHHKMGPAGYAGCMPKWEAIEAKYFDAGITPEPTTWNERTRNWFYGHGGTLDQDGKAIYNQSHIDDPLLPIEDIRDAVRDIEAGRFIPDRDNDELTRALKKKDHPGRARGTPGSKCWKLAFPSESKKYPDKSHQRRKEREAAEKAAAEREKAANEDEKTATKERLRNVEEGLKRAEQLIDRLSQQSGGQPQQLLLETVFDASGATSNRKSSQASTQLQQDDDDALTTAAPKRYPVDYITESTRCELKVQVLNLKVTMAVGMALSIPEKPTYHCNPTPEGYAVVMVDDVMDEYEELKLDHPAGEDMELTELGEAKKATVLWRKEHIVLPNYVPPRSPTLQKSNPPSPPRDHSSPQPSPSPPHHSPAQPSPPSPQASPPSPQPSPSPEPQSQKRKRTYTRRDSSSISSKKSPKRKRSPLPKVPHQNMKKLPGEMTPEELEVSAKMTYEKWKIDVATKKKPIEPLFPRTPEDHAACAKLKKKLHNPIPLTSHYKRSITKSAEAKERRVGKEIAQLGLQKEQSIEPLKVYTWPQPQQHQVDVYDPNKDPKFIIQYGAKAQAVGLSITEYLSRVEEFETGND